MLCTVAKLDAGGAKSILSRKGLACSKPVPNFRFTTNTKINSVTANSPHHDDHHDHDRDSSQPQTTMRQFIKQINTGSSGGLSKSDVHAVSSCTSTAQR